MRVVFVLFLGMMSWGLSAQIGVKSTSKAPETTTSAKSKDTKISPTSLAKSTSEKLTKALGLSKTQKDQIYKAVLDHATEVDKIKKSKLSNKDKFNKTTALDNQRSKQFAKIMTKEQYNKYLLSFP
jgi:hypothetical protein